MIQLRILRWEVIVDYLVGPITKGLMRGRPEGPSQKWQVDAGSREGDCEVLATLLTLRVEKGPRTRGTQAVSRA